jgi:UDP-N-acetyl-D-mannosaminuronate dehydrogenase
MFGLFRKKQIRDIPEQKTIKIKSAVMTKGGRNIRVVWVGRYAVQEENIKKTLDYMSTIFKNSNIVLVAKDITADGMGPVFVGHYAALFVDNTFSDFQWTELEVPIKISL